MRECREVRMCSEDQRRENNIKTEQELLSCSNSNRCKIEPMMQEQPWNKASTSSQKENKRRHSFYCQKKNKKNPPPIPAIYRPL